MKTFFTIKYFGKTILIMLAVSSLGKMADVFSIGYLILTVIAGLAYYFGSIEYQSILRDKKAKIK